MIISVTPRTLAFKPFVVSTIPAAAMPAGIHVS
jgi:hypothetical protein